MTNYDIYVESIRPWKDLYDNQIIITRPWPPFALSYIRAIRRPWKTQCEEVDWRAPATRVIGYTIQLALIVRRSSAETVISL